MFDWLFSKSLKATVGTILPGLLAMAVSIFPDQAVLIGSIGSILVGLGVYVVPNKG